MKSLWLKNYILNKPIFLYTILVDKLKHVISKVVTISIIQIFSTQTDILLNLLLLYKMAFVNLTSRNRCYFLIHTKVWFTKKIALTSFPIISYYILHKVFVYANPLGSPLPPLTQGQTSSRAGRGILSDIKIGWRIKCTYSRVGILPVQEKMNNHYVLFRIWSCHACISIAHFFLNRQWVYSRRSTFDPPANFYCWSYSTPWNLFALKSRVEGVCELNLKKGELQCHGRKKKKKALP